MKRKSTPFSFPNGRGQRLSGIIDSPEGAPLFTGVFAPCFTCTKDSHGAAKICRAMAERGAMMLRFDMTGLGGSEGDFSATHFSTRIGDIIAAGRALGAEHAPPVLLAGHSISGTAALSAAKHLPSLKLLATIGAPSDPARVIEKFRRQNLIAEKDGMLEINVMGRPTLFRKEFIDDMLAQDTVEDTEALAVPLLVFHAPHDDIVSFDNAGVIAARAGDRAELVTLDAAATHLFETRAEDAVFVAERLMEEVLKRIR